MIRTARSLVLLLTMLAVVSFQPVPATAAGTWTSPLGRVTFTTFDYTQYQWDPCVSFTFLTGTITPDPLDHSWFVSSSVITPEGYPGDIGVNDSPNTQLAIPYQFCGRAKEAGTWTVTLKYQGVDKFGNLTGSDEVSGTFTVTTLPLTSTTTLKVKPRKPDFRDKVTFRARSTFNDGVNAQGRVQLQFRWGGWAGQWEPLTSLILDEAGAADITYKWKLCNQLKFRALTVGKHRGPPKSQSEAITVTIDEPGACVTADSPRDVRRVFGV